MVIYIVAAFAVTAAVGVTIMFAGGLIPLAPSYNKTDKFLKSNIDELSYVADALIELDLGFDYDSIELRKIPLREEEKYSMNVRDGLHSETIPIPDELMEHIDILYTSGVTVITCSQNSVNFSIWSSLSESRGITYSITGDIPDGEQLIEVKQLSKENWYYYVNNFEKAKALNPHLFE